MKQYIEQLIKNKIRTYRQDYAEMLGDFDAEVETVIGYNGRQLLELLQNCDDEGSKEVMITLDRESSTVSISNNGSAFSKKGYRSLFIPFLSSKKSKRNYIGHKGLGFRSIINWSNAVEVRSNGLSLIYSEQNRIDRFNELFTKRIQDNIRLDEDIPEDIVPMPFLILPEIKSAPVSAFVTTIVIHYKSNFLQDIIDQVAAITAESLLFLRHVEQVHFSGFEGKIDVVCHKRSLKREKGVFGPSQEIINGEDTWLIFEEEGGFLDEPPGQAKKEKEFFQIKIAIEKDLRKSASRLYSFFPTNIHLHQPYVLHATFELDSTRKQISESARNKYILERAAAFTVLVALYFSREKVSYLPLKILTHGHRADSLANLGYYEMIRKAISEQPLFPCIDNQYRQLKQVIYIDDSFAELLLDIKAEKLLGIHLIAFDGEDFSHSGWFGLVFRSLANLSDPVGVLNRLAALKLSGQLRAMLIAAIIKNGQFLKTKMPDALNILTNGRNQVINGHEYIYTPATHSKNNRSLRVPAFTKIDFINRTLYAELLKVLNFQPGENRIKRRFIVEQLSGFCNIHSYEPVALAEKVISETNKMVGEVPKNKLKYVREMNSCLFSNFQLLKDETRNTVVRNKAPLISVSLEVKSAEELVLSGSYPGGIRTAAIFDEVYSKADFVASPKKLGLPQDADHYEAEAYLLWLKVNRFARYTMSSAQNTFNPYFEFLKSRLRDPSSTGYKMTYETVQDLEDILATIPLTKLLLWIYSDDELRSQLDDQRNKDTVHNHYYGYNLIRNHPSFIKFQIRRQYPLKFEGLLIDDRFTWANDFAIDYRDPILLAFGLAKSNVNELLVLLGAKDDFNQLSIERVTILINKIPELFPDGRKSQTFYKRALGHYREHEEKLPPSITLFADNGVRLAPYPASQVYFSDRVRLPQQLKRRYPVFNFPLRSGGVDAIEFFGINDLKDIQIRLEEATLLPDLTAQFDDYLKKLKAALLCQRINAIMDDDRLKVQASSCNKLTFKLCSTLVYYAGEEQLAAEDYEYLQASDHLYYIKVNRYDTINGLRKNGLFVDCFADIISLLFDLSGEKNDFKYLLKDEPEEVIRDARRDFGEDAYLEARELLGLADYKHAFWQAVFETKGLSFHEQLDDLALTGLIAADLGLEIDPQSIDYESFTKSHELLKVKALLTQLDISLEQFAAKYPYPISFETIHLRSIKDALLSKKGFIKAVIWSSLKNKTIEQKAAFLQLINQFEGYQDFALREAALLKHQFAISESAVLDAYVSETYGKLDMTLKGNPGQEKASNAASFTKDELYEIRQFERWKSLLYFSDAIPVIKAEIKALADAADPENEEPGKPDAIEFVVLNSDVLIQDDPVPGRKGRKPNVFTPRDSSGRKQKEKGNRSEEAVFDYLSANFSNVYRASEDNEGLHYDIRYSNAQNITKFVEVKSFDHDSFYLTKEEYDFGKDNPDDFEIWLVHHGNVLIPVTDFFSNRKYMHTPNEYLIHMKIN